MKHLLYWTDVHGHTVASVWCEAEELAQALDMPAPPGGVVREPVQPYANEWGASHWRSAAWLFPAGYEFSLWVNQGWREAQVLAALGEERLVEYVMPAGTSALRLYQRPDLVLPPHRQALTYADRTYRMVSYQRVPKRWLRAIVAAGTTWVGRPQQSCTWRTPAEMLEGA